jgi:hypothetical protein
MSHNKKIILLFSVIFVGIILIFGAYFLISVKNKKDTTGGSKQMDNTKKTVETIPEGKVSNLDSKDFFGYYKELAKGCESKTDKNCCISSVKKMMDDSFDLLDNSGVCEKGMIVKSLECEDSYKWCQPAILSDNEILLPEIDIENISLLNVVLEIESSGSNTFFDINKYGDSAYIKTGEDVENSSGVIDINKSGFVELENLFNELSFLNMNNKLRNEEDPGGLPYYVIRVSFLPIEGLSKIYDFSDKEVKCYKPNCEENFIKLKDKIVEMSGISTAE